MVVGVWSPSDWFTNKSCGAGTKFLKDSGFELVYGHNWLNRVHDFKAGTVEERVSDFANLYNDPKIDFLWAAEGGYAATEIRSGVEKIVREAKKPKLLVGYSDVSVIGNAFVANGLRWIMGPNICDLEKWGNNVVEEIAKLIGSQKQTYIGGESIFVGEAKGKLVASNLDGLICSFGSKSDPLFGNGDFVLALEEWRDELSTINRELDSIFDHVNFEKVKGIILGRFSQIKEKSYPKWASGESVASLCLEKLVRVGRKMPVWSYPEFGHPLEGGSPKGENFYPLLSGSNVSLTVEDNGGRLNFLG